MDSRMSAEFLLFFLLELFSNRLTRYTLSHKFKMFTIFQDRYCTQKYFNIRMLSIKNISILINVNYLLFIYLYPASSKLYIWNYIFSFSIKNSRPVPFLQFFLKTMEDIKKEERCFLWKFVSRHFFVYISLFS